MVDVTIVSGGTDMTIVGGAAGSITPAMITPLVIAANGTNDQVAINAALVLGYPVALVVGGNYLLTAPILPIDGSVLDATGANVKLANAANCPMILAQNVKRVRITGGGSTWDVNKKNQSAQYTGAWYTRGAGGTRDYTYIASADYQLEGFLFNQCQQVDFGGTATSPLTIIDSTSTDSSKSGHKIRTGALVGSYIHDIVFGTGCDKGGCNIFNVGPSARTSWRNLSGVGADDFFALQTRQWEGYWYGEGGGFDQCEVDGVAMTSGANIVRLQGDPSAQIKGVRVRNLSGTGTGYAVRLVDDAAPPVITAISKHNPAVVTAAAHGYTGSFQVGISGCTSNDLTTNNNQFGACNGRFLATYIDANTFSIPVNTLAYTDAYDAGSGLVESGVAGENLYGTVVDDLFLEHISANMTDGLLSLSPLRGGSLMVNDANLLNAGGNPTLFLGASTSQEQPCVWQSVTANNLQLAATSVGAFLVEIRGGSAANPVTVGSLTLTYTSHRYLIADSVSPLGVLLGIQDYGWAGSVNLVNCRQSNGNALIGISFMSSSGASAPALSLTQCAANACPAGMANIQAACTLTASGVSYAPASSGNKFGSAYIHNDQNNGVFACTVKISGFTGTQDPIYRLHSGGAITVNGTTATTGLSPALSPDSSFSGGITGVGA